MRVVSDAPSDTYVPDRVIGSKTGLIQDVTFENRSRDAPGVVYSKVTPAVSPAYDLDGVPRDFGAAGKGETKTEALYSVVGEYIERYCAFRPVPEEAVRVGTYRELAEETALRVDFEYLTLYADAQYDDPSAGAPSESDALPWVFGTDVGTDRPAPLPLWLGAAGGRSAHGYPSSNGCATGQSPVAAAFRGLAEVIERDAVMRSWFNGDAPTRVDLSEVPALESFRRACEPAAGKIQVLEFDSPTAFNTLGAAYVADEDRRPKFLLSAAAHLDFETAVRDVLVEVVQGMRVYRQLALTGNDRPGTSDATMHLGDNAKYYLDPSTFDAVTWLLDGPSVTPTITRNEWANERELLRTTLDDLEECSMTPILFDVTTRDVRDLGLTVLKACVPELVPMARPDKAPVGHPAIDESAVDREPHPLG